MNLINYSENDINRQFARNAYYGTSFSPEKRGDDTITGYLEEMAEMERRFTQWVTEENQAEMVADLEIYRVGYLKGLNALLGAQSRLMSTNITGASNFPVRQQEKRWATADKRRAEFLEWNKKALGRLERKYNPKLASQVISADDDNAIGKLQAKIAQAEQLQETMKKANAIIRKGLPDAETVAALEELGISNTNAWKLLQPDYMGRSGFQGFYLTNNNANIRRMKERIAELEREEERRKATQDSQEKEVNGVRVVENTDINRIQLKFPGKPEVGIRNQLKASGFRWSPTERAWQRQLNDNGRWAVEKILKDL